MQTPSSSRAQERAPLESAVPSPEAAPAPLQINIVDSASLPSGRATPGSLYAALLDGPRRAVVVYTLAGLCYALVTTLIFLRAKEDGYQLLRFLVVFWYYAWPVAITLSLLSATTWWDRLKVFAAYFLIIVVLGIISLVGNSGSNWLQMILLWLTTNFPAALLLLAFLNRRIQAVGPLVLTFMILLATGLVLLPTFVINIGEIWNPLMSIRAALGMDIGDTFNLVSLIGILGFGLLGWLAVRMIGSWYRRKRISEQSITMDAIWLLFAIFQAVGLIFEGEHWFTVSLMAFVVYKGVAWAGFGLAKRNLPSPPQPAKLLVLRVFSPDARSEQLFDLLARHWRSVGSIQLIAGPDLAATTVEPHEFLDFLSGRLARQFIDSPQTLDWHISQMDLQPDHDGQFRVNDFFCYDDTWKMVLTRLVRESDAVLMDLRGFSSGNAGCIFEINELVDVVPLGQVVFVVDDSTDEPFLRKVMQEAWERMDTTSPNRVSTSGAPSLVRLEYVGDMELKRLLHRLASAVRAESQPQGVAPASVSSMGSSS
jgi:hypothetical protein